MPKAKHLNLTAEYLRERLSYDRSTGVFTWRYCEHMSVLWNARWAGKVAGRRNTEGRGQIRVNYVTYLTSRLAWLYVTGEWPRHEIDHIDCDAGNDRFANLRDASRSQNMCNTRLSSRSTSGIKGVCFDKARGKWLAHIHVNDRFKNLGRFDTKEAAAKAYANAATEFYGEFARVA